MTTATRTRSRMERTRTRSRTSEAIVPDYILDARADHVLMRTRHMSRRMRSGKAVG